MRQKNGGQPAAVAVAVRAAGQTAQITLCGAISVSVWARVNSRAIGGGQARGAYRQEARGVDGDVMTLFATRGSFKNEFVSWEEMGVCGTIIVL